MSNIPNTTISQEVVNFMGLVNEEHVNKIVESGSELKWIDKAFNRDEFKPFVKKINKLENSLTTWDVVQDSFVANRASDILLGRKVKDEIRGIRKLRSGNVDEAKAEDIKYNYGWLQSHVMEVQNNLMPKLQLSWNKNEPIEVIAAIIGAEDKWKEVFSEFEKLQDRFGSDKSFNHARPDIHNGM